MIIYVVKEGDTIYSIAREFNKNPESLISENELTNPNRLVVGQTIVITEENEEKLRSIAVNGYIYPEVSQQVLRKTLPNLSMLTIFTYGFTPEGELIGIDDNNAIEQAKAYGVAPLMLISTLTKEGTFSNELADILLNDEYLQDILINNILVNLREKNYFGLDIDFEFIPEKDRLAYAKFIEKTTNALNQEGFYVIVALAPKTSSEQTGLLYEAHDYNLIGKVANAVLIMTYEWGYTYSSPMPVAPINKVREVVNYAVSEIEAGKIFMGIPNYGYNWTLPYVRGESRAKSLSNVEAVELAQKYNAVILFDEVAQSPYFYYTDEEGREHIVHFEDARSIFAKLSLVNEYSLAGVSYWNLMKFFPQNWLVLNSLYDVYKI